MDSPNPSLLANLSFLLEHRTVRWFILIFASFLLLFAQANQSRIHGDSIRYAGIARLMADSGEYTTLRFGEELSHHGPLLFWLTAFAIKLFGPTPFAASLFSRLFGLGCIILTGWLGSHLFGKNVGWMGALALATSYVFFRNSVSLRMDSALMFGVLVALTGYFCGERSWGPPLFYSGIALAVLAKSLPGFLPLFLAPFHALLTKRLGLPWRKQSIRWLRWSPLLLVPVAWWGYLAMQYGTEPFSFYLSDFLADDRNGASILQQFFEIYLSDLGPRYLPWSPFALIGIWMLFRDVLDSNKKIDERAAAGLIIGWAGIVLITTSLKPAQYGRYLMPAYPAISIMTGTGVVGILRGRLPAWIPGTVALSTLIGAIFLACFPVSTGEDRQSFSAVATVLNQRLPAQVPVPVITSDIDVHGNPNVSWKDEGRCQFFLGRAARPTSIGEVEEAATRGRVTAIISNREYPKVVNKLNLRSLMRTDNYVLVEAGSGEEILLPQRFFQLAG